ncbi:MAG TPA: molybdopterin cofactor-binding domain-containing protein [Stellaceae bacterium]|nr:molybdopterin cofactor-binding domain-containing protein [Stellaceae bacterium]
MNQIDPMPLSRRALLGAGGALVVTLAVTKPGRALAAAAAGGAKNGVAEKPPLKPENLASWVAVGQDGKITGYFGKMDPGQGVDVAIRQIIAEELDVPVDRVALVMGDTKWTVNQGGASGSTGIAKGGKTLRYAAAEARRVLVQMAADQWHMKPEDLTVEGGVVQAKADPSKKTSYGDLIGGRYFDVTLEWNGQIGNPLFVHGKAVPKKPEEYKIVGKSYGRDDITEKVFGKFDFITEVKVPGMMHGRMIRPPVAGAVPEKVDESSLASIPGAKVVWKNGFLGVVTENEWDAVRAISKLHVTWTKVNPPFPKEADLYDHIRKAPEVKRKVEVTKGDLDGAMKGAVKTVEAQYEWPFQSHASMAPACAVADVRPDGVTVWTGSQKPHFTCLGVSNLLNVPVEKVRAIWVRGPGSYGRNDAGDAAMDAAVLSQAVGKPVRVQWMRREGHGWDPKGPASIHNGKAGLDKDGKVVAFFYESKGFSRVNVNSNESVPGDTLAGQLLGAPLKPLQGFDVPGEGYTFANQQLAWATIPPLLDRGSPLRTSHLRDPVGPQMTFGSESFIDEVAEAAGADPVAFRLANLGDPRAQAVIKAAAEKANWQAGQKGSRGKGTGVLKGRGIAYIHKPGTYVAVIADIELHPDTGRIWARRFTVGHDCGLVVNPEGLKLCIEGNIVQGASRAILEEVHFDPRRVTSVDWNTYSIFDITDVPEAVDIVLINRPDTASGGAGEASTRPVAAAIANAIFDATGKRLRRAPFDPKTIKALMA